MANRKNIIIFGAGGHAKVVIDMVERQPGYHLLGLIDPYKEEDQEWFGYPVLCRDSLHQADGGVVAIGDNWVRHNVVESVLRTIPGFCFVTVIHPFTAIAKGVEIGDGTVIMAGVVINSNARIGRHCIVNTNASVDHDTILGSFVSLAPNSSTGGMVRIGEASAVGMGANVIHSRTIGEHVVIGAGSTVIEDIPSCSVAYGSPCKVMRKRDIGEKYL